MRGVFLEKLFKRNKDRDTSTPFYAQAVAIEALIYPEGAALYTLSRLTDREVRNITLLKAFNELLKRQLRSDAPTVLDIWEQTFLLLRMAYKGRRIKEVTGLLRGQRINVPVQVSRMKEVFMSSEEEAG